ncbi:acetylesterase [Nibricoccus aquaticus]|uniref:Acetylesterase n=1 Tax=Nibricoccus aquaticus TaxID=2576891 RepID=A0A290QDC1_9BACT|nr:acetylxylan esterase [Nibricoccus aquaticus]ATC66247.1 acetylesterase [Nibricoccus aquaticus]
MPLIDKPLAELKKYRGLNPRPTNFDAYWRESLAELDALDPQITLIPNKTIKPAHAECFDLWFTGVGGARIHAKYLRPKSAANASETHPALLQFHGYSGNSGDWADKLNFVHEGFCVAALDVRGQGGQSEDVGGVKGNTLQGQIIRGLDDPDAKKLLFRAIFLDTALLARVVMSLPEIDATRVGAMGASQGGALTLACAALEPRIKRAASIFPFLCDYQRVWEMDQAKDAYQELRNYFRSFDPRHENEKNVFEKLGYIDCQHLAPRIKAEVLMLTGLMDTICPPSTQFAAYNKIKSKKRMIVYPDFGHEGLPGSGDALFEFFRDL